jgi:hypothetical protein
MARAQRQHNDWLVARVESRITFRKKTTWQFEQVSCRQGQRLLT